MTQAITSKKKRVKSSYYWYLFCLKLPNTFITCLLRCPKTTWRIVCYNDKKHILWGVGIQTENAKPTTNAAEKLNYFPSHLL